MNTNILTEIFSIEHLQIAAQVIAVMERSGIDADQFAEIYNAAVLDKVQSDYEKNRTIPFAAVCPSCGNKTFAPVVAGDARVVGCRVCRYSKIVYPGDLLK